MLVPEFPGQTHSWIWREASALRAMGVDVGFVSTRRPKADCPHHFAPEARARTHYLHPPGFGLLKEVSDLPGHAGILRDYHRRLETRGLARGARFVALAMAALELLAWAKRQGIEHVHVHSCADAAHVAAMCRALGGPPYSLTLHGDLGVYGDDHWPKMEGARFVSTAGEHLIPQLLQLGISDEKIFSNPMGVDIEKFAYAEPQPHADPLRLVTIARLHRCKGHIHVLEALKTLLGEGLRIDYHIVGDGPDRERLVEDVRRLGLGDHVVFRGAAGEEAVASILRQSDVYVLASVGQGEAAPVGIMEAMSSGCPVIASRIGSTPAMLEDGVTGLLVPQGDAEALADAIRELIDPDRRRALAAAAREFAVAHFDARTSAFRLLERIFPPSAARLEAATQVASVS